MTVITVVYARPRGRPISSTTSRTVSGPRFHTRSMTALSSGPRRSPEAARRMRRRGSVTRRSSHLARSAETAAREHARMPFGDALATMGQGDVELDDVVAVARRVGHAEGKLVAFDEAGQGHRRELALGQGLREPAPDGRPLRRLLAQGDRVEQAKTLRIRQLRERLRGLFVLGVVAANEEPRIAGEEVEVEVDGHVSPGQILRRCRRWGNAFGCPRSHV